MASGTDRPPQLSERLVPEPCAADGQARCWQQGATDAAWLSPCLAPLAESHGATSATLTGSRRYALSIWGDDNPRFVRLSADTVEDGELIQVEADTRKQGMLNLRPSVKRTRNR